MNETQVLLTLAAVAKSVAEGRGVQLDMQQVAELASKAADLVGALVSDVSWKAARVAGAAEAAKVQTVEQAEKEQR